MTWFRVDDGFYDHPKVEALGLATVGLWTVAGSWCAKHLTDGRISVSVIRRLGGTVRQAKSLVSAGLWTELDANSYQFKDWNDYQPRRNDVLAEREAAKARMAEVRARRRGVQAERSAESSTARSSTPRSATHTRPDPTRPDQTSPGGDVTTALDPTSRVGAAFEQVWQVWPRAKIGDPKAPSSQAFLRMVNQNNGDVAQCVRLVSEWARAFESANQDPNFCPSFARWVDGKRWNDPFPQPVQRAGQGPGMRRQEHNLSMVEKYEQIEAEQQGRKELGS